MNAALSQSARQEDQQYHQLDLFELPSGRFGSLEGALGSRRQDHHDLALRDNAGRVLAEDKIESGHDLAETMERNRRRQSEAAQSQGLSELAGMLLPLSVALARLTARCDVAAETA